MQDRGRQLRNDRRGVADLPIKLVVIMVILSISVPIVMQAADNSQKSMMNDEMEQEIERIKDASAVVYYSGSGSSRILEIKLPDECEISLGGDGEDAYSLRSIYDGEIVSTTYFEKPPIPVKDKITLSGCCSLTIRNIGDNQLEFDVE